MSHLQPRRSQVVAAALAAGRVEAGMRQASPEQARTATGQAIGGVAPVGHPQRLRTVVDRALFEHDLGYAAAGTPHSIVPLTPEQLVHLTSGLVGDVGP